MNEKNLSAILLISENDSYREALVKALILAGINEKNISVQNGGIASGKFDIAIYALENHSVMEKRINEVNSLFLRNVSHSVVLVFGNFPMQVSSSLNLVIQKFRSSFFAQRRFTSTSGMVTFIKNQLLTSVP